MNEAESQVTPNEEEAIFFEGFDGSTKDTVEDTTEPTTEEVSQPAETKEEETDYTPLLNKLKANVKYMDQEVSIDSIDDVIKNFQKGLDYDRKVEKIKELENSEDVSYIREKAKESGMTPSEYIKAIKNYEQEEIKRQEELEVNEMIENGVAENIARKVIETNRLGKELQQEKLKIKQQEEQLQIKAKQEAEDNLFLETYPNVNIKEIPNEVFEEAKKTNLITAYTQYQNKELQKQLEILKQTTKNDKTSPVKGTTEHGGVVVEKQDDFLKGFNL
jgi:hypothetical protein